MGMCALLKIPKKTKEELITQSSKAFSKSRCHLSSKGFHWGHVDNLETVLLEDSIPHVHSNLHSRLNPPNKVPCSISILQFGFTSLSCLLIVLY